MGRRSVGVMVVLLVGTLAGASSAGGQTTECGAVGHAGVPKAACDDGAPVDRVLPVSGERPAIVGGGTGGGAGGAGLTATGSGPSAQSDGAVSTAPGEGLLPVTGADIASLTAFGVLLLLLGAIMHRSRRTIRI